MTVVVKGGYIIQGVPSREALAAKHPDLDVLAEAEGGVGAVAPPGQPAPTAPERQTL